MTDQLRPPDKVGLYVHIPWCVRKCPYCDFNSHEVRSPIPEAEYVDCLVADMEMEISSVDSTIETVYFGGGTPSLFSPTSFEKVLANPRLANVSEVTMEANPGTLEHRDLSAYCVAGITRLSLGVQSLCDESLQHLGRIHSAREARESIESALNAGFESVNLDLMYGLPQQSFDQAIWDLEQILSYQPEHVSWYELTFEPNTVFGKFPPSRVASDGLTRMSQSGLEFLKSAGYEQYEVSAFTHDTHRFVCQHNVNYWQFGDYIGIGAGAHGKLTTQDGRISRTRKPRQPSSYMQSSIRQEEYVATSDLPVEFMMNALRLREGVTEAQFGKTTGLSLEQILHPLDRCRRDGLIEPDKIALTDLGWPVLNSVVERFL